MGNTVRLLESANSSVPAGMMRCSVDLFDKGKVVDPLFIALPIPPEAELPAERLAAQTYCIGDASALNRKDIIDYFQAVADRRAVEIVIGNGEPSWRAIESLTWQYNLSLADLRNRHVETVLKIEPVNIGMLSYISKMPLFMPSLYGNSEYHIKFDCDNAKNYKYFALSQDVTVFDTDLLPGKILSPFWLVGIFHNNMAQIKRLIEEK